jgi:hypothetical protein
MIDSPDRVGVEKERARCHTFRSATSRKLTLERVNVIDAL